MERWRAHVANAVEMFTLDLRTLLEPRGFIRILQLVFAIFAFSVACSYKTTSSVTVTCPKGVATTWHVKATYPFRSESIDFITPKECAENLSIMIRVPSMACGVQGKAEFFVTVGVLSLFICLVSLPVYLCKTEYYENNTWLPLLDFVITAIMTLLWFISSCAWSDGVSQVKNYLDTANLIAMIPACGTKGTMCAGAVQAKYTSLNIAIILGFLNIVLWAGSSWFVYKETNLHSQPPEQTSSSPLPPPLSASQPPPQRTPFKPPEAVTTEY